MSYPDRPCAECDETFTPGRHNQRYCSMSCKRRRDNREAPSNRWGGTCKIVYSKCRGCNGIIAASTARVWCSKKCRLSTAPPFDCETCVRHVTPGADAHCQARRYCGAVCRKRGERRRSKGRRRDRERLVYVRDSWVCQLCGEATVPDQQVPHPLAPTIDHVVPRVRGGSHDSSNLQCAHFICNCLKGDRVAV